MSRIGRLPIELKNGASANISDSTITVKGPKGELAYTWNEGVTISQDGDQLLVTRISDSRPHRSLHGLTRSLVQNMVDGVTNGYKRDLEINGVGFKAEVKGNSLFVTVGFTNPYEYPIPDGIEISVEKNTRISVTGIDKQKVGQAAAQIRAIRPPEPYKGKGIKYADEQLKRKVGKTTA